MTVSDQRSPRRQVGGYRVQFRLLGNSPEPVPQSVGRAGLGQRRAAVCHGVDQPGSCPVPALVEQEDRLEVGLGRFHQLAPAGDGPGRDVLVRTDDPGRIGLKLQRAYQATLDSARPRFREAAGLRVTGRYLFVDVEGWR